MIGSELCKVCLSIIEGCFGPRNCLTGDYGILDTFYCRSESGISYQTNRNSH